MLGALATEPNVLAACLYDNQGSIFAEYRSPGDHDRSRGSRAASRWSLLRWQVPDSLSAVSLLNGERTGSIALIFDLTRLSLPAFRICEDRSSRSLTLCFAHFSDLHGVLRAPLGIPLVQLAAVARRISTDKDYSVRAAIRCGGETGLLVDSFNEMLSQIESRERALRCSQLSQESEERYALAARGANDGLWDWNLTTGEIYFSPRWSHMLGYSESESWSSHEQWFSQIHAEDRERVRAEIAAHCEGKTPEFVSEYRMRHKNGGYIWTLSRGIAVRDSTGKAIRMAGSQTDITEGKVVDPLTRLPNRLYLIDRLESAIETNRSA